MRYMCLLTANDPFPSLIENALSTTLIKSYTTITGDRPNQNKNNKK